VERPRAQRRAEGVAVRWLWSRLSIPLWVVAEAVAAGRAAVAPHQHLPGAQGADGLPYPPPGLEEGAPAAGAKAGGLPSGWAWSGGSRMRRLFMGGRLLRSPAAGVLHR